MSCIKQVISTLLAENRSERAQNVDNRRCYFMLLMSSPFVLLCYLAVLLVELYGDLSVSRLATQPLILIVFTFLAVAANQFHVLKAFSGCFMVIVISVILGEEAATGKENFAAL